MKALLWIVGAALVIVVGIVAEEWSWQGRLMLAALVNGVPYLIRDAERPR